MAKYKKSFEVLIEAKVSVAAENADAARRKLAKAFAPDRRLGVDVAATEHTWVYDVDERTDAER